MRTILIDCVRTPTRAHSYHIIEATEYPTTFERIFLRRKPKSIRVVGKPKKGWQDLSDQSYFDDESCKIFDRACEAHETNVQLAAIRDMYRPGKKPPVDDLLLVNRRNLSGGPNEYTKDGVPVYELG